MHAEFKRINNTGKTSSEEVRVIHQIFMLKSPTVTNLDNFIVEEKIKFQNYLLMSKSYCLVSVGNKKSKFLNSSQLFNMKFFVVKDLNRATLHEVVVWNGLIWRA